MAISALLFDLMIGAGEVIAKKGLQSLAGDAYTNLKTYLTKDKGVDLPDAGDLTPDKTLTRALEAAELDGDERVKHLVEDLLAAMEEAKRDDPSIAIDIKEIRAKLDIVFKNTGPIKSDIVESTGGGITFDGVKTPGKE